MKNIGFIGVGTMGLPMALNLLKNGHSLSFYDPFANKKTIEALTEVGAKQETIFQTYVMAKIFLYLCSQLEKM